MPSEEYYISLGKSYGRPLSRNEWDKLPSVPSSAEIMKDLGIVMWEEFTYQRCGFKKWLFTKGELRLFGRRLEVNIKDVSPERWDEIVAEANERKMFHTLPNSSDVFREYKTWGAFQNAVLINREKISTTKYLNKIERLFLEGRQLANVAKDVRGKKKIVERDLELLGCFYPEFFEKNFPTLESVMNNSLPCFKTYEGEEKRIIREDGIMSAIRELPSQDNLTYLGLTGPQFIDFLMLDSEFNLAKKGNLVAERDRKSANFMTSLRRSWHKINGGEQLRKMKIYKGPIERAIELKKYNGMKFDIVNFDWNGGWAKNKQNAIVNLFGNKHLSDEAIVILTLNNSEYEIGRAGNTRGYELPIKDGDHHIEIARKSLEFNAKKRRLEVSELFSLPYKDTQKMLAAAYLVRKKRRKS